MPIAKLTRIRSDNDGTFGTFEIGNLLLKSGEAPWRWNDEDYSCIPPGSYECVWSFSEKFGRETYLLQGVSNRSEIRIHPANFMGDKKKGKICQLFGCISLGLIFGYSNKQQTLLKSQEAVRSLENLLKGESFTLNIVKGAFDRCRVGAANWKDPLAWY